MKNKWDERYDGKDYYYGTEANSFLIENSSVFSKGSRILCLAEGEGRNAVYLAQLGFEVTAVDYSQVGIEKIKALAIKNNVQVHTICADLNDFEIEPLKWEGIISIWCHLPSALRSQIHQQVILGLKPGGYFLLEAYTPEQLKFKTGGPQDPDLMPTLLQIENELQKLEPLIKKEALREISEGIGHQGISAVVQFLGKKPNL
jgi:SAM-dependent methyltransferase